MRLKTFVKILIVPLVGLFFLNYIKFDPDRKYTRTNTQERCKNFVKTYLKLVFLIDPKELTTPDNKHQFPIC